MAKDREEKWRDEDRQKRIADQRKRDEELQKFNESEEAETVRQRVAKLAKKITHYDRVDSDVELEFMKIRGSDGIREDAAATAARRQQKLDKEVEAGKARAEGARKAEQDRQEKMRSDREDARLRELQRQEQARRDAEDLRNRRNQ